MDRYERGIWAYEGLIGGSASESLAEFREMSPEMYEALIAGAFAGTLGKPELDRASRELATLAILAAVGGADRQLATHAAAAVRLGLAPSELRALCEHVSVYAGFPRALNALRVIDRALGDADRPRQSPSG